MNECVPPTYVALKDFQKKKNAIAFLKLQVEKNRGKLEVRKSKVGRILAPESFQGIC